MSEKISIRPASYAEEPLRLRAIRRMLRLENDRRRAYGLPLLPIRTRAQLLDSYEVKLTADMGKALKNARRLLNKSG